MDWVDFVQRIGLPTAALLAIGWFLYKEAWPEIQSRIKSSDVEREKYLQSLDKLASSRETERKEVQHALETAQQARFSERAKFLEVMDKQSDVSKENALQVIQAFGKLNDSIAALTSQSAANQREILKAIADYKIRASKS